MTITVDWIAKIVSIPKLDMTQLQTTPYEVRGLNLVTFSATLKDLEDSPEGIPYPDIHNYNPGITLSGVFYAGSVEIINDYTITFEDDAYAVSLIGANSNVADVVNLNTVSIRSANSAGLIDVVGITEQDKLDIADRVWDEVLTGGTHNIATSAGRRLRALAASIITEGVTVSATGNTITLNGDASSGDGAYDPASISIIAGTGYGQTRGILEYDGVTKTAAVDRGWKTIPDETSEYIITAWAGREHVNEGLARDGSSNTIKLNALADDCDCTYIRQMVFIRSGTGEDQVRTIIAYAGDTKIATVDADWDTIPDVTSAYVILPTRGETKESISTAVWGEQLAVHIDDKTTGHALMQNAYGGKVFIDPVDGVDLTEYPGGIRQHPVKTIATALIVAVTYKIAIIHIIGNLTVNNAEILDGLTFTSDRSLTNSITIVNASTEGVFFDNLTVNGALNGGVRFTYCVLNSISGFTGGAKNSLLVSDIILTSTDRTYFTEVDSFIDVANSFLGVDIGVSRVNMIRCHGNYEIKNKTGTDRTYIGLDAGRIKIASSCVDGSIFVTGLGEITDESGPGCEVNHETLMSPFHISDTIWDEQILEHVTPGSTADILTGTSIRMGVIVEQIKEVLQGVVGTLDIVDNGDGTETVSVFNIGAVAPDTDPPLFTMTVSRQGLRRIRNP